MLSTPEQNILRAVSALACIIIGIILYFRLLIQIPDWLALTIIVIVIYTYSRLVVPKISETMIPQLMILFISFLIFRMDEFILQSSFTEILTRITSEIVVIVLFVWEVLLIITTIGLIAILYKKQGLLQNSRQKWYILFGISIILLIFTLIANITNYPFTVIDSMSLVFYQSQDIVRVDIIRDCSGIYGIMIFSCSFLLFGSETKRKIKWDNKQTLLLFLGGIIGVYSLNILRIFSVINASLFTDLAVKSLIHSYLGSVLILLFVISYWTLIWKNAFLNKENVQ